MMRTKVIRKIKNGGITSKLKYLKFHYAERQEILLYLNHEIKIFPIIIKKSIDLL